MSSWANVSIYYREKELEADSTLVSDRCTNVEKQDQDAKSLFSRQMAINTPHHLEIVKKNPKHKFSIILMHLCVKYNAEQVPEALGDSSSRVCVAFQ